ncbi:hypothetical protein KAU55_00600 [Candidatus Bathyarchaeota archaeon]|nr:hypothetical protein [Candidatus Bathyarchaeota archaeon]
MNDALLTKTIELKCEKDFLSPALFVNPQRKSEGQLLNKMIARYPIDKKNDGLNSIDGLVISIKDWEKVAPILFRKSLRELFGDDYRPMSDRVLIIDPSLHLPFMGMKPHKRAFCEAVEWLPKLDDIVSRVGAIRSQRIKTERYMNEIYPLLDVRAIQGFLEFQIRNRADILVSPSVPLTSRRLIESQIEKMGEMNRESRILLNTVFSKFKDQRDLLNLVTLNPSVLASEFFEDIKGALLQNNPDLIAIRVMNLNEENAPDIETLLKFIKELAESKKPVFILNVREFGYVAFYHGASVIATPIAKSPYTVRSKGGERPPKKGKYYHPSDMLDYSYKKIFELTRPKNYRLPCHCEICDHHGSLLKADKSGWNEFRKVHFLLVKDMEIKEFRESEVTLRTALKDKFGRSKKTGWVSFLD